MLLKILMSFYFINFSSHWYVKVFQARYFFTLMHNSMRPFS